MSWFTDLIRRRKTLSQVVGLSIAKLKGYSAGLAPTDDQADAAAKAVDNLTDVVDAAVRGYLAAHAPGLPGALGAIAATQVLNLIDAAAASAMQAVKDNN